MLKPNEDSLQAVHLKMALMLQGFLIHEILFPSNKHRVESPKPDQFFAISLRLGLCREHNKDPGGYDLFV